MLIEGKNAIHEALKSERTVETLLVEKGMNHQIISIARQQGVKVQFVEKSVLDKKTGSKKHQGFVAEVSDFQYSTVEEILANKKGENNFIVICDGVEDPHNLGSILRVCECAGVDGVIIGKNRQVFVNDTVSRCSAGAVQHVKVAKVTNLTRTIEQLKQEGVWVYCADMDGTEIYSTNLKGNLALVIGGEGKGVSRLVKENCDGVLSLPLFGQVNSLNASVACGIVVYEVVRQRQN